MNRKFENVSDQVSIETCTAYYSLGFDCIWNDGKDLTLAEQKNAYQDGNPSRHKQNISNKSISKNSSANKTNYSEICLSCGRKLRSEISKNRGYGSSCYSKMKKIEKQVKIEKVEVVEQLEGQVSIDELDELRRAN
ncbi:MAG: hypothetical protein GX053_01965 [Tissierella sp.]|nr:hypothetical protein [Tissierella sp.]